MNDENFRASFSATFSGSSPTARSRIVGGERSALGEYDNHGCKAAARAAPLRRNGVSMENLDEGELSAALERDKTKEKDEKDNGKTNEESLRSGFFRGVSAFARSIGDSVKNAANAAGNATTSAANAVVESAKSFVPEKKPETALVFYRGDLLVFEDRIEKHGRKYYFNALKNLTIEKSVREIASVEVGSILGRTALGALNGAANGGLIGAVAGGVQSAIDAGDAKESKPKETRTEYSIGAPERLDREETIYSADDAAEANETLREILAALDAAGSTPALWKDGRRTDAENFRFD